MRIAFVHDWLVTRRGGENVLAAMLKHFPNAPVYTLVHTPGIVGSDIEDGRPIHTSFIQNLWGAPGRFRPYLPLFFSAMERFDLSAFDVVVSTSHCVAKGVRTNPNQFHLSYIHTPMRYLWDQLPQYLPPPSWLPEPLHTHHAKALNRVSSGALWWWRRRDRLSAQRPDVLLANSAFVATRIERLWGRGARVLHPPVDTTLFSAVRHVPRKKRERYVVVSALVPYKRVDIAVRAAVRLNIQLDVVGEGPELQRLHILAHKAGPNQVRFLGRLGESALRDTYARARALLFPGVEDFGIVPVEAMAAGCPVIALAEGGALETVLHEKTGVLYHGRPGASVHMKVEDLCAGIEVFEERVEGVLSTRTLQAHAETFAEARFDEAFLAQLAR